MNATTATRKATRYIVRTNGVPTGEPTTNRARAIREGERYATAADRTGDAHHITVTTEATGKIVFEHRSTATPVTDSRLIRPAVPGTLCEWFHSYGPNSNGYGCGSAKGQPGPAVHILTRTFPVASAGTPLCASHSPYDVRPEGVPTPEPATRTLVIDYDDSIGSWGVCVDKTGEFIGHASTPMGARTMRRNLSRTNA